MESDREQPSPLVLKPCPHCDSTYYRMEQRKRFIFIGAMRFRVRCLAHLCGFKTPWRLSRNAAIGFWHSEALRYAMSVFCGK